MTRPEKLGEFFIWTNNRIGLTQACPAKMKKSASESESTKPPDSGFFYRIKSYE
ncbi:MAG: hypothetical protein U0V02_05975 [Anaerolineales bacterium]